jgi:hypothetical protein
MFLLDPDKDCQPNTDQKIVCLGKYFSRVEENEVGDTRGKTVFKKSNRLVNVIFKFIFKKIL